MNDIMSKEIEELIRDLFHDKQQMIRSIIWAASNIEIYVHIHSVNNLVRSYDNTWSSIHDALDEAP